MAKETLSSPVFTITSQPIQTAELVAQAESPSSGALVVFEGRVRNHHQGQEVIALEYSSHPKLAQPEGQKLIEETLEKFPETEKIVASHRTGKLGIGEIAVSIAVSSPHRPAAFAACDYLALQLKNRLPVWKHEFFADGSTDWT